MSGSQLLIAGAGYLGQALAERVLAEGQQSVSILRRSAVPVHGASLIQADLQNPGSLNHLPDVENVVYCASADASDDESYRKIYHEGLLNLVNALRARGGFRRLVYISSTSVYTEQNGAWIDESDTRLANSGPSRFMVSGEKVLLDGADDFSILRLGGIYGPGRTWFLRRVKEGAERIYAKGGLYSNRIHKEDCVGMILHVLKGTAARQIYNGVDSEAADRNEVIRWMAGQLGQDPQMVPTTEDISEIPARGNKRISNKKIRDAGYEFIYPSYREGYQPLLREFLY